MAQWQQGLFRVLQRPFHRSNHLALHGKRFARNARARCCRMAAAAELRGDFVHIDLVAFGAKADACEFGFDFLEDARDDDRLDGANVINESFGVIAVCAGAGQIGFFEPEPRDAVIGGEAELAINELEQSRAGDGIRLINFVANSCKVRAARDEFRARVKCAGARAGILKRAGVGGNGGEQ